MPCSVLFWAQTSLIDAENVVPNCSKLYSDAVSLCLRLGEKDAAINIITEMEDVGVPAPEDILTDVLRESQEEGS
jgi:hypothetical protein